MDIKITEEDLYNPVCEYLKQQGFAVRGENNFCDITAMKDETLLVVELKKNLTVELLAQAVKRQKISDMVYIAVPKPKKMKNISKWNDVCHLIKRLELGLIFVNFKKNKAFVEIIMDPVPFDRSRSVQGSKKRREKVVKEFLGRNMDLNKGGSRGKKLVTAYREHALYIACTLEKLGPMSTRKLKQYGTHPEKTSPILSCNFYKWFEKNEEGLHYITPLGKEAIQVYNELSEYFKCKIDEIVFDKNED